MAKSLKKVAVRKVSRTQYENGAKITILTAGRENPRRKGTAPYKRYDVLLRSRTVGAFLKKLPKWRSTITRAVREKLVVVK